ncbi:MAG: nitrate/nitrite transporter NrtS [Myxococcota bacterium]
MWDGDSSRVVRWQRVLAAATTGATIRIALRTSLVVGTALNLVNHGEALTADWRSVELSTLILNYAIPYLVATWAAARATAGNGGDR